jgi:hypothetical protein
MMRGLDSEALTVAMALAPGVYARNRHHALHQDPRVRRARARASLLRGLVRHLAGAEGPLESVVMERTSPYVRVRYRVARLGVERTAQLTPIEAACLLHLAAREGVEGFEPTPEDRTQLVIALRRLVAMGDADETLSVLSSSVPRGSWPPSSSDARNGE